jgi:hypothetical protein
MIPILLVLNLPWASAVIVSDIRYQKSHRVSFASSYYLSLPNGAGKLGLVSFIAPVMNLRSERMTVDG